MPNGVWRYENTTGQLTAFGAGVARGGGSKGVVTQAEVAVASAPFDGRCMTTNNKRQVRVARCLNPKVQPKVAVAQAFKLPINAEPIDTGDLVTLHSSGHIVASYLRAAKLGAGGVELAKGNLTRQQTDKLAVFKVRDPICGARYHISLQLADKPGFFLSVARTGKAELEITNSPRSKNDACWLPTPGPARPKFGSGCPGITFALQSRSKRAFYIHANADGGGVALSDEKDLALLSCWRPVPPAGAPSAEMHLSNGVGAKSGSGAEE
jgi:hypothetical protein